MKKKNIQFLVSVLAVIGSLIIVDLIVGKVGELALKKMPDFTMTQVSKDNFRLNRVKTDIVLVGSSRCTRHYVSSMLRDSINAYVGGKYSIFNCGVDGRTVNTNSCAAESIMSRYTPKLLIFDVSEAEFAAGPRLEEMESSALNYYDNQFVREYLNDFGTKERLKISSNLFRFNRRFAHIAQSFINRTENTGYEPIYGTMTEIPEVRTTPKSTSHNIDEYSLKVFTRVLETAKEKGVYLIVVASPRFRPTDSNLFLADLCHRYDVPFIELYDLEEFNSHPEYFKDKSHLNDDGAHIYTELFYQTLKPYLEPLMR